MLKSLLVIGIPVLLWVGVYLWLDPFKVLRHYDNYSDPTRFEPTLNKGAVSISNFQKHYPACRYNAFVLGSSVSVPYRINEWKKYLPEDARGFHFDSSGESPRSLYLKLKYLQSQNVDLKYALIVVPPQWFAFKDRNEPPFINHPDIDPDISIWDYHWLFFKGFLNREFFRAYVASAFTGKNLRVGKVTAVETQPFVIHNTTNEEVNSIWDDSIRIHPTEFYSQRKAFFDIKRVPHLLPQFSDSESERYVDGIAQILTEEKTDYYVVIGPTLDKSQMNSIDKAILQKAFGTHLKDYTTTMNWVSDIDTCYYDPIHYRYPVASLILDSIYSQ